MSLAFEVVQRAQVILVEHGWVQHRIGSPSTGCCVLGAVLNAAHEIASDPLDADKLFCQVRAELKPNIMTWNDEPGRTLEEVLGHLLEAEKRLADK